MADENLERITILLQARDKDFQRAMERNNKVLQKFAAQAEKGTTASARAISRNLNDAGNRALMFGANFAKGLAVGAVTALLAETAGSVRDVISELADLQDAADRIDMGVEDYQALRFGMKLAGVGTEEFSKALEKFNENVGDAARGATPFGAFLARSGIQIKDAAGNIRPTNELLKEFADLVQRAPEGERMSMLSDAFGKVGKSMVLAMKDGGEGLEDMMAKAVESGAVLDESIVAKAAELDDKFDVLTARVGNFFKTAIVGAADGVNALVGFGESLDDLLADEARARTILGDALYERIAQTKHMSDEAVAASDQVAAGMDQIIPAAEAMASTFEQIANSMRTSNPELAASLDDAARNMRALVGQLNAGMIDGDKFRQMLGEVISDASDATDELMAIDGVGFSSVLAGLDTLARMLGFVEQKGKDARAALPGSLPMDTGTPLSSADIDGLLPPTTNVVTTSPRSKPAPNGIGGVDWGAPPDTGKGGSGKGGGGGAKKQNDEQREAARLFEQTRTEAEKYAAELLELNDLLDKGYITQDTFNRSLDMAKEKYLDVGGAAEFWKDINDDLKDSILDLAVDGVDSFDAIAKAIKRAAVEALLFGTGPMANMFSGGLGGVVGAVTGGLLSFDGGGDTGMGARSGGLDGKGGFLAMMHPQESVIDRTKGQGGGGSVDVRVFVDEGGQWQARVEKIVGSGIRAAAPELTRRAVGAVYAANSEVALR